MSPHRHRAKPGDVAGELSISPESPALTIRVCRYGPQHLTEVTEEGDLTAAGLAPTGGEVVWIDVHGLGDEQRLRELAGALQIPDLALADVVNTPQRSKVEVLPDHLFVLAHQAWRQDGADLGTGQVSLFLGDGYVLSLQDGAGDCFAAVRQRLRNPRSRTTRRGADYLLYALVDTLIDLYFPVLERYAEEIDALQDEIFADARAEHQQRIFSLRRDLLTLRRGIWPLRELAGALVRDDSDQLDEVAEQHLRDCFDHAALLTEMVDSQRDLVAGLNDAYLASVSHRMNEVMKVLTIIATVFIPLSFVAGVFGMNFERDGAPWNMPELGLPFGYAMFWGLCLSVAGVMLWLFRRNRWF